MSAKRTPQVRQTGRSRTPFYAVIGAILVVGLGALFYTTNKPRTDTFEVDPATVARTGDGPAPEGYLIGNPDAPVQVVEFADFECGACMQFATITEPDVRQRLVETGQVSFRYYFFPLEMHQNAGNAAHAAACAGDQDRFWEMHDALFNGFNDWALGAARNPRGVYERYAETIGLDVNTWGTCYDDETHREEILAHKRYGIARGVNSTPTFVIGDRLVAGALTYDRFKAFVDSAAARSPGPRVPDPATDTRPSEPVVPPVGESR